MQFNPNSTIVSVLIGTLGLASIIGAYRLVKMESADKSYEVEAGSPININTTNFSDAISLDSSSTGSVAGRLCYPSGGLSQGIITAKNTKSGIIYTQKYFGSKIGGGNTYTMELIPGLYKLRLETFLGTNQLKPYSGYYMGSGVNLDLGATQKSEVIEVQAGKTIENIDLCYFYPLSDKEPEF